MLYQKDGRIKSIVFGYAGGSPARSDNDGGTVADGQWHFAALTNGDGIHRLYLDGELVGEATHGISQTGWHTLFIGNSPDPAGPFTGDLSDVLIYERALSVTELDALYADAQQLPSSGQLIINPQPGILQEATVTVTVMDAGADRDFSTPADNATFSREFTLTVDSVNDPPTLDAIADLTIDENASQQTVNLTGITAGGSESQPLRVTAVSADSGLIPAPTVTYTSAEATGSLKFQPVADQIGSTTITVTVEDGGLDNDFSTTEDNATTQRQFTVTVTAALVPKIITPGEFTNQLRPRISWTAVTGAVSYPRF